MRMRTIACFVFAAIMIVTLGAQQRPRLNAETLASLQSSSNDPSGDFFADTPENLGALIDAFVADTSMVSPMYLIMAANTALRPGVQGGEGLQGTARAMDDAGTVAQVCVPRTVRPALRQAAQRP